MSRIVINYTHLFNFLEFLKKKTTFLKTKQTVSPAGTFYLESWEYTCSLVYCVLARGACCLFCIITLSIYICPELCSLASITISPPPVQWCSTCFVQDHFLALCYTIFFLALRDSYFICSALFFFLSLRRFFFLPCALRLSYPAQRYFSLLCYAIFFLSAALFFYLLLPCATIFLFLLFIFFLSLQCATLLLSLPYTIMYFLLRCTMFSFLLPSAFFFSDCYHCSAQYNLFSFPLLIFFLVLHCLIFAHFARVIVRDIFFHSLAILILLGHSLFHFVALSFYIGAR